MVSNYINHDNMYIAGFKNFTGTPSYFISALLLLLLPLIALVCIMIIWLPIGYCKKHTKEQIKRNVIISILVVLFIAHPTLTSTAFAMMNCYEIEKGE